MRFMVMHKVNDSMEAGDKPTPKLIAEMGKLIGDGFASGLVVDAAGLQPTATRTRLKFEGGACTLTKGPLTGAHEPMAGVAMIKVKDLDEAIGWSKRLASALGDVEIELGPVNEPWDIGAMAKPEGQLPLRFLVMHKLGTGAESSQPRTAKQTAALAALVIETRETGVLISIETLEPSAKGARLHGKGGKHTVVDGPFAESKELIAGYSMLRMDNLQDAIAWTVRYAEIIGDVEVDIRPVAERG